MGFLWRAAYHQHAFTPPHPPFCSINDGTPYVLLPFLCLAFTKEWLEEQLHAYKAGVESMCSSPRWWMTKDVQVYGVDPLERSQAQSTDWRWSFFRTRSFLEPWKPCRPAFWLSNHSLSACNDDVHKHMAWLLQLHWTEHRGWSMLFLFQYAVRSQDLKVDTFASLNLSWIQEKFDGLFPVDFAILHWPQIRKTSFLKSAHHSDMKLNTVPWSVEIQTWSRKSLDSGTGDSPWTPRSCENSTSSRPLRLLRTEIVQQCLACCSELHLSGIQFSHKSTSQDDPWADPLVSVSRQCSLPSNVHRYCSSHAEQVATWRPNSETEGCNSGQGKNLCTRWAFHFCWLVSNQRMDWFKENLQENSIFHWKIYGFL